MTREFVELPSFRDDWKRLGLTDEQLRELEAEILFNPKAGSVIEGTAYGNYACPTRTRETWQRASSLCGLCDI